MTDHVAIIGGTGDLGFALATRWAKAGIKVTIGSRDKAKADAAAEKLKTIVPDAKVDGLDNPAAAASSSTVVVAVPFSGFVPIYRSIAESLQENAVVIDATVPVEASVGGKATHVFGVWEGSAAQLGLAFLPKGTKMCAAFHTLSASAVGDLDAKLEGDILVCGSKLGKEAVKELIGLMSDLRYVDAGPLENARIIEPITALLIGINHRYGTDRSGIAITGIDI
ncbi:MAG: 8-hydroxy-5-deazaflavin:NADPH oxidoreductase [Actinomycetota bacterium]|jgi:NADPH-dependent F420 reductase|nr:8-hydroxy-5-deazaflavin:NADPH oxidoreductase [Actinomycetota bacterium]